MKRKIKFGGLWFDLFVEEEDLAILLPILVKIKMEQEGKLKPLTFDLQGIVDLEKEAELKELEAKYKDSITKEKDQYSTYWLQERDKVAKLEQELKDLRNDNA